MSRGFACATAFVALMVMSAVAPAQAKVERAERVSTYDVVGDRIEDVIAALDRMGPPDDSGEHFHARTDARIDWTFSVHAGAEGCAVTGLTTKLHLTVIMPHLIGGGREVRREFKDYVVRLMHHESGHVDNAHKMANEIDAAITGLPPAATCKAMKDEANAIGHRLFDEGARRDVAYDRVTDHGRLQGAHFP
jgi:predicted secreted Zn-dependent protease